MVGELVFVLEVFEDSLEVLLPGLKTFPGRVLLADPLYRLIQISGNACNYNDNGVVLLFIYFVRSCKKLEKDG